MSGTLAVFSDWLGRVSPWLQGLFGGAGATLVWEGLLKPRRERRALAHVLAEEIGFNLQLAAHMLAMYEHNPKGVPQDFQFLTSVYDSVVGRVGELPTHLVGSVVLLYAGMRGANTIPDRFAANLERRDALAASAGNSPMAGIVMRSQHAGIQRDLEMQLKAFKNAVGVALQRSNAVLPKLRRAAVPRWRLDYYFRKKTYLALKQVEKDVREHATRLGFIGDTPRPPSAAG